MKKTLLFAFALCAIAACGPKGPKEYHITENIEANIGKIKEIDGPVSFKLYVLNDLKDTLYPKMIYTPCSCTAAEITQTAVAPGEEELLEVTYNPAYRPGKMMEEIHILYVNSPVKSRSVIICGEVEGYLHPIEESCRYAMGENLYSSHKKLGFGVMAPGETRDMFFRYGNNTKHKANLSFEIPEEWKPYVRMRQPGKIKGNERDTIHVKFSFPQDAEKVSFAMQPIMNGKPTEETISIEAFRKPADEQ